MIDIENQVFECLSSSLGTAFSGILVVGEEINAPSSFPCVSIIQADSNTDDSYITTEHIENVINVVYEVNVYSNKKAKKKSECKEIMAHISDKFNELGFSRSFLNPIPNFIDSSIYRMVARFVAKVDKNDTIYRR